MWRHPLFVVPWVGVRGFRVVSWGRALVGLDSGAYYSGAQVTLLATLATIGYSC